MNFNEKSCIVALRLLKQRVIKLRKLRTDHEFLEYLCKIRWLICFIRLDLHDKWFAESSAYSDEVAATRKVALGEVKSTYQKIKNRLNDNKLLGKSSIKKRMCIIDTMFSQEYDFRKHDEIGGLYICNRCDDDIQSHRASVFPYFERCLFDQVKYLCSDILELKREDLIRDFVEIIELNGVKRVNCAFFAPSIFKSQNLEAQLNLGKNMQPWFAWNMICSIESVKSEKIRDVFRKTKQLRYESSEDYIRNAKWLEMHNIKAQIELIENKQQGVVNNDYKPDFLNVALDIILQEIFKGEFTLCDEDIVPLVLELDIDEDDILYLYVEWSGFKEILYIQSFKDKDKKKNKTAEFIKKLLKESGKFFSLSLDYASKEKVNIKKHLSKSGIDGILYDLFIKEQSGSCVSLLAKRILLSDLNLTKYQFKALNKKIDELHLLPPSSLEHSLQPFMKD